MVNKVVVGQVALATLLGVSALQAATQGFLELGSSGSFGDLQVTFVVPPIVRITVEGDVTISAAAVGLDSTDSPNAGRFCVYSNQNASAVDIALAFTNDSASGTQTVLIGQTFSDELAYTVDYKVAGGSTIQAGLLDTGYADDESADAFNTTGTVGNQTCDGGWTHDLDFTVASADFEVVTADTYSDIITITATVD